jgi:hypothetical protein
MLPRGTDGAVRDSDRETQAVRPSGAAWPLRDNTEVPAQSVTSEAAERLRLRYPQSRLPRPLLAVAVVALSTVFLGWLIWTATVHATPAVSGQVTSYTVLSDRQIAVTLTVDRPDPSRAAVCNVVAEAADFQAVGALDRVQIPARDQRVVDVTFTLQTLRRATTASVKSCSLP